MSEATGKYPITMPRDLAEAARDRSGRRAYVAAVARQVERDELIAVAEAEHGPVTDEKVQALRDRARHPGPTTVLTSDPEDLTALCGTRVTVIKI